MPLAEASSASATGRTALIGQSAGCAEPRKQGRDKKQGSPTAHCTTGRLRTEKRGSPIGPPPPRLGKARSYTCWRQHLKCASLHPVVCVLSAGSRGDESGQCLP